MDSVLALNIHAAPPGGDMTNFNMQIYALAYFVIYLFIST